MDPIRPHVDATRGTPPAAEPSASAREQALTLAREFESMLMLQMIRQMRQSLLDEEEQVDGLGNETLTDTIDGELSRALSASGGLGFAKWFAANLSNASTAELGTQGDRRVDGLTSVPVGTPPVLPTAADVARPTAAPSIGATLPASSPEASGPSARPVSTPPGAGSGAHPGAEAPFQLPASGEVTSSFGLRADPFHGRTRLHSGVDIRAAYGRSVASVAEGEVTFAGERGGYGQMVVVRHEGGVETRYAHLSAIDVHVGDRVQGGEVLGRSGSSGRATGPHLHFEVVQQGRHVDPVQWAHDVSQLKPAGSAVDLPFDWSPRPVGVNGVAHED